MHGSCREWKHSNQLRAQLARPQAHALTHDECIIDSSCPGRGALRGDGLLDDEEPPEDPHEQHPGPGSAAAVPGPAGGPRRRAHHRRAAAARGLRLRVRRLGPRRLLLNQPPVLAPGPAPRPPQRQRQLLVEVLPQQVHPVLLQHLPLPLRRLFGALRPGVRRHGAGDHSVRARRRRRRGSGSGSGRPARRRGGREARERELAARRRRRVRRACYRRQSWRRGPRSGSRGGGDVHSWRSRSVS
ncbi:hypothetical protein BS78_06G101300 [Paspalum vaginatum]|nr:hypothetical protein BS78_06G101300 [Paspalum vaginatum]